MLKFDEKLYLVEMYQDPYFPNFLVDKVKALLADAVIFLETGERDIDKIQEKFDQVTIKINELQDEFCDNGSEIETGARESIGDTVHNILKYFSIDIDVEEAIRERDW